MRLLHFPHGYWPATGGAEHLAEGWSEGLASRGHDVRVSVADLATPEGLYRFGIPRTDRADGYRGGVEIRRIALDSSYRVGGALFRRDPYAPNAYGDRIRRRIRNGLTTALRNEIETFAPDVVLTLPHLFENVRIVFDLHRELRFPLVWAPMLHETDPNWPVEEVREMVRRADVIVAMTNFEAERLVDAYGADPERVRIVPPGVDAPDSPPNPVEEPPTVLFVGRLSETKGFDVLPNAMTELWDHVPDARLVIAGAATPDTPRIRASFSEIESPSGDSVEFRENVSEEEKQRLLRSATVLVLPSERESFGIVILEAWTAATPVVVVDSPVMRSTVDDGVNGRLFPARDARSLASVLRACLENPDRSHRMGLAGYNKVKAEYTWATAAGRLERACELAVSRPSQNPS